MKSFYHLSLLFLIFILSCENKNNTVGYTEIPQTPKELTLNQIEEAYSYTDTVRNYSANPRIIVGNYNGNESRILLKFKNLPKNAYDIKNAKVKLISKRNWRENDFNVKVAKATSSWKESEAEWTYSEKEKEWTPGGEFADLDSVSFLIQSSATYPLINYEEADADIDSVSCEFSLPGELIRDWIYEDDSLNCGLVLYSEDAENSFAEFYSRETSWGPELTFEYKKSETSSNYKIYETEANYDTFINSFSHENEVMKNEEELLISNIFPSNIVLKFNLSDSVFINSSGGILPDSIALENATVNKAEIYLYPDFEDGYFKSYNDLNFQVYLLNADSSDDFPFYGDELIFVPGSSVSTHVNDDTLLKIDVTKLLQTITGDKEKNKGFVITSTSRNRDYSYIKFYKDENPDRKPKLVITYSPSVMN